MVKISMEFAGYDDLQIWLKFVKVIRKSFWTVARKLTLFPFLTEEGSICMPS
jgi:hypothetical protein